MIEISPEKVMHVALRAREYDNRVASWDDTPDATNAEEEADSILEDFGNDDVHAELSDFIDTLNIDEQEALVALTWIGRGTYSAKNYKEALKTARREHVNETKDYLLGIPLLSDYLKEGLSQMGYSVEQLEEDMIRCEPDWPE
jgi:thermostable 8-oxoguanine DNA glycosylase